MREPSSAVTIAGNVAVPLGRDQFRDCSDPRGGGAASDRGRGIRRVVPVRVHARFLRTLASCSGRWSRKLLVRLVAGDQGVP
ncbi:hypothetical protein [Actinoalloteichus caeruleus]|uniref:hypothetical protein n=1 Tax=Actinoalloteichus cyanogriseus TaxID=2893586 RepID=UPI0004AB7D5B|nr:hypothetical protein [Actinoalloteichus caeruleus]